MIKKILHKLLGEPKQEKPKPNGMVFQMAHTGATYYFSADGSRLAVLLCTPEPDLTIPCEQLVSGDSLMLSVEQEVELLSMLHDDGESYDMQTPRMSETVRVVSRFYI